MKHIDFLAIGDIVIDAFIQLNKDQTWIENDNLEHTKELCMAFGSKLPYDQVDEILGVGNSPNAAVSAARLGLNSALMSHVGKDENGKKCLDALEKNNVIIDYMTSEDDKKTNYHYVLRFGAERTILIKHDSFTYDLKKQVSDKSVPSWVYFSSVGEHGLPYHHEIARWVKDNNIKMAFQPGTFQIKLGYKELKDIYEATELFFCNREEAMDILSPVVNLGNDPDMTTLLQEMRKLGPNIVCITDGANGAYAYDGTDGWFMPMYPDPMPPIDRTGAGDSFSSTFTSALIMGKSLDEALRWGPINSMSVVQYVGAQKGLLTTAQLQEYLDDAPTDYVAKKII